MLLKILLGLLEGSPKSNPRGFTEHQRLMAERERKETEKLLSKSKNTSAKTPQYNRDSK